MESNITIPYWKDYKTNAVRGIIAAICCAAIFILFGLVYKFRWKSFRDDDGDDQQNQGRHNVAYNRDADDVVVTETTTKNGPGGSAYRRGLPNPAVDERGE